jgi:hypothetical protein
MNIMVTKKVAPAVKAVKKTPVKKPVVKKAAPATAAKPVVKKPVVKKPAVKKLVVKQVTKPAAKPVKIKKPKLVRDSFTMPQAEYDVLAQVKKSCIAAGFEIKKSELLRIGVAMLQKLDAKKINEALLSLTPLKAGRPSKHK